MFVHILGPYQGRGIDDVYEKNLLAILFME